MKKAVLLALGVLISFCLTFSILITAVEAVCYWMPGYFEKEYEKYDVLSQLPEMSMSREDGLMAVTEHMMKYLRGDADAPELQIEVMMGGKKRGFFTEREILHMEDVRSLFVGAQVLRVAALIASAVMFAGMLLLAGQKERFRTALSSLAKGLLLGTGLFLVLCAALGAVIASDFTSAFITFHHIFFDNDLWILDSSVDMLINIVPEGFFFDTAARILAIFGSALVLLCAGAAVYLRKAGRKNK